MTTNLVSTFSLDKLHSLTKPNLQAILKEIGVSVQPKDKAHALRNILTREWPAFQTRQNPRPARRKASPQLTPKTKPSQGQSARNKRTRQNDDDSSKTSDDEEETDTDDDETVVVETNNLPLDDSRKTNAQEKRHPQNKRIRSGNGDSDELILSNM